MIGCVWFNFVGVGIGFNVWVFNLLVFSGIGVFVFLLWSVKDNEFVNENKLLCWK